MHCIFNSVLLLLLHIENKPWSKASASTHFTSTDNSQGHTANKLFVHTTADSTTHSTAHSSAHSSAHSTVHATAISDARSTAHSSAHSIPRATTHAPAPAHTLTHAPGNTPKDAHSKVTTSAYEHTPDVDTITVDTTASNDACISQDIVAALACYHVRICKDVYLEIFFAGL